MKPLNQWFAISDYDEYQGWTFHWYNKSREWGNERFHLVVGDLFAQSDAENGGFTGPRLDIELQLAQSDMPMFYLPDNEHATYNVHWLSMCLWRWGFTFTVRGRL